MKTLTVTTTTIEIGKIETETGTEATTLEIAQIQETLTVTKKEIPNVTE